MVGVSATLPTFPTVLRLPFARVCRRRPAGPAPPPARISAWERIPISGTVSGRRRSRQLWRSGNRHIGIVDRSPIGISYSDKDIAAYPWSGTTSTATGTTASCLTTRH